MSEKKKIELSEEEKNKLHQKYLTLQIERSKRMKIYYAEKKKSMNEAIKDKFVKIYENLDLLGENKGYENLDEKVNTLSANKFKCYCFDLMYEINKSLEP